MFGLLLEIREKVERRNVRERKEEEEFHQVTTMQEFLDLEDLLIDDKHMSELVRM